ncbi:hypothetical protein [Methanohalobium evestigatum]|uniref:hypothetical protein n=1 Tax=Methanohalobium evestigatum TaxID=2322 RepID=UPI0012F6639C|nr:hypothetical protein [Methanohalobium evestigatum]
MILTLSIHITPHSFEYKKFKSDSNPIEKNHLINNIKKVTNWNHDAGIEDDASTLKLVDPVLMLIILVMAFLLLKAIEHV